MKILFSLRVRAIDSSSWTDDIDEKSEAIMFQMQYTVSTGQFRISLPGMNSTADRSSFQHHSINITCGPGFVKSIDRKGCGEQQLHLVVLIIFLSSSSMHLSPLSQVDIGKSKKVQVT